MLEPYTSFNGGKIERVACDCTTSAYGDPYQEQRHAATEPALDTPLHQGIRSGFVLLGLNRPPVPETIQPQIFARNCRYECRTVLLRFSTDVTASRARGI